MELPAFSAARRRVAAEPAEEAEELQGPQSCVPAVSGLIILVLLFVLTAGAMSSRRGGAGAAAPAGLGSAEAAGPAAPHLGHRRDPGAGRPAVPAPAGREALVLLDDDLRATCEQGDEQYMRDCLWPSNYAAYTLHKRAALVANGSTCSSLGFVFLRINPLFAGARRAALSLASALSRSRLSRSSPFVEQGLLARREQRLQQQRSGGRGYRRDGSKPFGCVPAPAMSGAKRASKSNCVRGCAAAGQLMFQFHCLVSSLTSSMAYAPFGSSNDTSASPARSCTHENAPGSTTSERKSYKHGAESQRWRTAARTGSVSRL